MTTFMHPVYAVAASPRRRHLPKGLAVAIGFSIGVHAAAGLYLASRTFLAPEAPPLPAERLTIIELFTPPRAAPPPPAADHKPATPIRDAVAPPVELPVAPITAPVAQTPPETPQLASSFDIPAPPLPSAPPAPKVVSAPDWLKLPGAKEFARYYPDRAARTGTSGLARMSCQVTTTGKVRDCRILSEAPEGQGFGAAALKLARYFQMRPMLEDGRPVEGASVTIPVRFQME